jgi:hypothetical protein
VGRGGGMIDSMSFILLPRLFDSSLFVILGTDSVQLVEELSMFIKIGILVNINFVRFEVTSLFLNKQRLKQLLDLRDPATNLLS